MPRMARQKTNESIFHVMCRSISEVKLFKSNEDKLQYIEHIKKYQKVHKFRVLGYCLMGNHVHLIVDVNGADISQIMHGINFSYAHYFNKKYKRNGHLFQDRFKSKIVDSDRYLVTASAYIHNNPVDIKRYQTCPEKFPFSSLAIYLGLKKDPFGLVDSDAVLQLFGDDLKTARDKYYDFVMKCEKDRKKEYEFENERSLYKNQRTILARESCPEKILDYVSKAMNIPKEAIHSKYNREITEAKVLAVMLMKTFCNFTSKNVCCALGNITQASVANLVRIGIWLFKTNEKFSFYFDDFVRSA